MPNDDSTLSIVKQFHGEEQDKEFCPGKDECPHFNDCKVCPAAAKARFVNDVVDSEGYRSRVKDGYYSTSIKEVVDKITGKKKYVYTRPPG